MRGPWAKVCTLVMAGAAACGPEPESQGDDDGTATGEELGCEEDACEPCDTVAEQDVLVLEGSGGGTALGSQVFVLGDLDADGSPELALATDGEAHVVSGLSGTGTASVPGDLDGFVIEGATSLAAAGDVNGDDIDDAIARGARGVYVVFGGPDFADMSLEALEDGNGGFRFPCENTESTWRNVLYGLGDVDGDGIDDLGGDCTSAAGHRSGNLYVVLGGAEVESVDFEQIEQGVGGYIVVLQPSPDHGLPPVASGIGDMNGDGVGDMVLGDESSRIDDVGRSWVLFGRGAGEPTQIEDVDAGTGGFAIVRAADALSSGDHVAGVGDVSGDGRPDVLVSEVRDSGGPGVEAPHYIVFGKADTEAVQLDDVRLGMGGFMVVCPPLQSAEPCPIGPAGDTNGDGVQDLVVGVPEIRFDRHTPGHVYVIHGGPSLLTGHPCDQVVAGGGESYAGELAEDLFGSAVAGGTDLDGDGRPDLVVGAPGANNEAGRAYVIWSTGG